MARMKLPDWPPHDWRAWAALASGIVGGAVLTAIAVWLAWIVAFSPQWDDATQAQRLTILGRALLFLLATIAAVLLAQGLAINRRKISVSPKGIVIEGGGGPTDKAIEEAEKVAKVTKETDDGV